MISGKMSFIRDLINKCFHQLWLFNTWLCETQPTAIAITSSKAMSDVHSLGVFTLHRLTEARVAIRLVGDNLDERRLEAVENVAASKLRTCTFHNTLNAYRIPVRRAAKHNAYN